MEVWCVSGEYEPGLQCPGYWKPWGPPNNWFVPGVIEKGDRTVGPAAEGWITTFGTVGTAWEAWGRGHEGKRGVNQQRHNEGLGWRGGLGFLSPLSWHPCVAFWSLFQAAAAAEPLWQATGSKKESFWEPAIRCWSSPPPLSSHGYSLTLTLYEIIFQPGDNVLFSGTRTSMPNPINPRCSLYVPSPHPLHIWLCRCNLILTNKAARAEVRDGVAF